MPNVRVGIPKESIYTSALRKYLPEKINDAGLQDIPAYDRPQIDNNALRKALLYLLSGSPESDIMALAGPLGLGTMFWKGPNKPLTYLRMSDSKLNPVEQITPHHQKALQLIKAEAQTQGRPVKGVILNYDPQKLGGIIEPPPGMPELPEYDYDKMIKFAESLEGKKMIKALRDILEIKR